MDVQEFHRQVIDLLVAERERAGLNQGQLARRLKLRQSRLCRLERGQRKLELCEFFLIAQAVGFDPIAALLRLQYKGGPLRPRSPSTR